MNLQLWGALVIPFIVTIIIYFKFKRKITWWEILIPIIVCIITIFITAQFSKWVISSSTEFLGTHVTTAYYYEPWNEKVSCRHPIYCYTTDCSGTGENRSCHEVSYVCGHHHSYDVDYYPAKWVANLATGSSYKITQQKFEEFCNRFGSKVFVNLNRHYHNINGNAYMTTWDNKLDTIEPYVYSRSYENKVRVSKSKFHFDKIDPKKTKVLEYPSIINNLQNEIFGDDAGSSTNIARQRISKWNSFLGTKKQVKMFIIIYKDKPIQYAFDQESYWKGPNKNEFILNIGIDKENKTKWAHVMSWTEVKDLKLEAVAKAFEYNDKEINLVDIVDWMGNNIERSWKRKEFKEFDYLRVDPPTWAYYTVWLLTIIVTFFTSLFILNNDINKKEK